MSIFNRAVDVLRAARADRITLSPEASARALADAGLLASDLPGGWKLADHRRHGRVLVVRLFGDKAIYATPHEMLGIHTHVSLVSDLTFVGTDNQTTEEA